MKRIVYILSGVAVIAATFWFLSASHVAAQTATNATSGAAQTPTNETSDAQYQRALAEQAEQSKRYAESLRKQEETLKRAEALIATQEEFLKRQAADLDRYEKSLDTWEKQQKQSQKYLDSLTKSRCLTNLRSQPSLALSAPLSRFTSRVGGGSAFYVRPHRDL